MLGRAKPEAVARTQWQQDRKTALGMEGRRSGAGYISSVPGA